MLELTYTCVSGIDKAISQITYHIIDIAISLMSTQQQVTLRYHKHQGIIPDL